MKKFIKQMVFNLTLVIIVLCGLIFTLGFGSLVVIARNEVSEVADQRVTSEIEHLQDYIDGYLARVEDAAYGLCSWSFGNTVRDEKGHAYVVIDPYTFKKPAPDDCYRMMKTFMDANPIISGVSMGFEPDVYKDSYGEFGFAPYMRRMTDGSLMMYDLGQYMNYRELDSYRTAKNLDGSYWGNPYREPVTEAVVTTFSVPLHSEDGKTFGVLSLAIGTENFRVMCKEATPYENAEVIMLDRNFRIMVHVDESRLLKSVVEDDRYSRYSGDKNIINKISNQESGSAIVKAEGEKRSFLYFAPVKRAGWTVTIECPESEVLGSVNTMKRNTAIISIISTLLMILILMFIYRRIQSVSESKASMEKELEIASQIQMGMVPKKYPAFPERMELDVFGMIKPAKTVGGDLFDYFIRDDKFYFCIGDVSGKGVPASLVMTVTVNLFRNISHHAPDPYRIVTGINDALAENNSFNMFCTMFLGALDLKTGVLRYCNAGHNPPVMKRIEGGETRIEYLKPKTNMALGVMEGFYYVEEEITLAPGDAIFMYTDGVTEAENVNKTLFGEEAALDTLRQAQSRQLTSSQDVVQYVYGNVVAYAAGAEQSDDITMLAVEYKGC